MNQCALWSFIKKILISCKYPSLSILNMRMLTETEREKERKIERVCKMGLKPPALGLDWCNPNIHNGLNVILILMPRVMVRWSGHFRALLTMPCAPFVRKVRFLLNYVSKHKTPRRHKSTKRKFLRDRVKKMCISTALRRWPKNPSPYGRNVR